MQVEIKGFIFLCSGKYDIKPTYRFYESDMSKSYPEEYVRVCEHTLTAEVPDDFDPKPQLVAGLRAQQVKVRADAQVEINRLEERVQSLLCLEHKPAGGQT